MKVFLLALEAALYPTLLAAVVILLSQPRPRRLITAYLAGGMLISIALGLIIVFVLDGSKEGSSGGSTLNWGADLVVGGLALLLAVALATRADEKVRRRRARRKLEPEAQPSEDSEKEPWSQRILSRGSVPIVFAAAMAINVPGAAYLIALKDIAAGGHSTGGVVIIIVVFNVIMFALAEIPLLGLVFAPERTHAVVADFNEWLSGHGRQIATVLCAVLGAYLVVRGIANAT